MSLNLHIFFFLHELLGNGSAIELLVIFALSNVCCIVKLKLKLTVSCHIDMYLEEVF